MNRLEIALHKKYQDDIEVRSSLGTCWVAEGLTDRQGKQDTWLRQTLKNPKVSVINPYCYNKVLAGLKDAIKSKAYFTYGGVQDEFLLLDNPKVGDEIVIGDWEKSARGEILSITKQENQRYALIFEIRWIRKRGEDSRNMDLLRFKQMQRSMIRTFLSSLILAIIFAFGYFYFGF